MFFRKKKAKPQSASLNYEILNRETLVSRQFEGWFEDGVAQRQDAAYRQLLQDAYQGKVRTDFRVAAEAIAATGISKPDLLEVGCGSGYYSEILDYLLHSNLHYTGLDNSKPMVRLAAEKYPKRCFLLADATHLPFQPDAFDIVFNGVSLMHIASYESAISEANRIARSWCIFHTVPILKNRPTTLLQKNIYGGGVSLEFTFNEKELLDLFAKNGLKVTFSAESIPYNLERVLGEKTITRTYLCKKTPR